MTDPGPTREPPYPAPAYAWTVVVLLLLTYIVSWLDRQILSFIIGPIKASFALNDTQVGLLLGPAFAIFYILLGIPVGWLADRKSRKVIIACGIALWSLMTAASAFARNFTHLFLARIGVGVGESVLTPSALSMISDYFPKEKRARAVSLYMSGISLGTAIGSMLGGWIVGRVTATPEITLPLFGAMESWKATFLIVGLPGLVLAAVMMLVREPYRRDKIALDGSRVADTTIGQALAYFWQRRSSIGALWVGQTAMTITGYAQFFNPELFRRTWGWGMTEIGFAIGAIFLVCGPGGANFGGWLADRFTKAGDRGGPMRATLIAITLLIPTSIIYPLMPTPELALAGLALSTIGGAMASACGAAATVAVAPNQVRAQATAVYWVIINLAGLFIGPPLVGLLTDQVFGDPAALKYGLAIVPALVGLPCILLQWWGLGHYRAEVARLEAAAAPRHSRM
ncbi:MAG: MFS transporter [Rhodospirillaceae bacterium]|nr:MFS transporter [Rhodospirillaceae bacterium]